MLLRHLGVTPTIGSPWLWFHQDCADAEIDIALDGQEDIDDAIGRAVTWNVWQKAADKRSDLGDPATCDPLEMCGPAAALARAGPMDRGPLLMALSGGLPTETRLYRADRLASPACRWCGAAKGIAAHHLRTPTKLG